MRKISAKFLDRPMSSMESATWWIEYVLRHDKDVLRSHAMDLNWWQVNLLDVHGFILFTAAFLMFMGVAIVRYLVKNVFFTLLKPKISNSKKVK